ncbi:MAG: hypothetical protein ACP5D7_10805 [Limnospira sp.]
MTQDKENRQRELQDLIRSGEIESIYFNEFSVGVSKHDVFILLRRNGKEEIILNASHITAKAFVSDLSEILEKFEKQTNYTIPNSDEIEESMTEDIEL